VAAVNIHGTGLVLADTGILIRGPSGSGKSLLALDLLDRWCMRGEAAMLVSDDRVDLQAAGGNVTMLAPAAIAGLVELRGRGVVSRPYRAMARVSLLVDLVDSVERMPEEIEFRGELLGVALPRCPVPRRGLIDPVHQYLLVADAIGALTGSGRDI
jgi:serine kinase of HPr protein (carbohydrate metabolism regulator)